MAAAEATAAAANQGSPTTVANCRNTEEATRYLPHHNQLFCPRFLQQKQQLLPPPLLLRRLVVNTSCFRSMRKTTATCQRQWHGLHATRKARKEQESVKDNKGIDELTIEDGVDSGTRERERALAWGSDLGFHQNG
jgi:hypothetical protein